MNQPGYLKNPSADSIEIIYFCLAEVEALVEEASDNDYRWLDKNRSTTLLKLAEYLGLRRVEAILADVNETELKRATNSERNRRMRSAFNADKLQLFCELDANRSSFTEMDRAA